MRSAYARLPIAFEELSGSRFAAHGPGYRLSVEGSGASLTFPARAGDSRPQPIRLGLAGANPAPRLRGEEGLRSRTSYLIGRDPAGWRTGIANYRRVRCEQVYPGVDLVFHGTHRRLEYDFVVAPGARADRIRLEIAGARSVELNPKGELVLHTPGGDVVQQPPVAYQDIDGQRRPVAAGYSLKAQGERRKAEGPRTPNAQCRTPNAQRPTPTLVAFDLGGYDRSHPLVIDPVLDYSTYLGGAGGDGASRVAVDSSGAAYVVGNTLSRDFPMQTPLSGEFGGGGLTGDVFVSKLSPDGTQLLYSTYLGGAGNDAGADIAVDASGSAVVTGTTESDDFPVKNPLQAEKLGPTDAFVVRLDASGSGLLYSTYLGGDSNDEAAGIALDPARNAYVTGRTFSANFPLVGAFQPEPGGLSEAFVAKLNAAGSALLYSTFLGGSADDRGNAIKVDSQGSAYVTGETFSIDFPVFSPRQRFLAGARDAFVAKLAPAGNTLVYSTYLGGKDFDSGLDIALDDRRSAYVAGTTSSTDFPTQGALQAKLAGRDDAFVAKLSPFGTSLSYSTYLGGTDLDGALGIAVDRSGSASVTGATASLDFPVEDALAAELRGPADAFVAKLKADGSGLTFSTYLGGAGTDAGSGVAVDAGGRIYVAGRTSSADFPTLNPVQASFADATDAFVTRLDSGAAAPAAPTNLRVVAGTDTELVLTWDDTSPDETGFKIQRRQGTEPYAEVGTVESNVSTYTDKGLTARTIYSYRVQATNAGGDSDFSNEVRTVTATPPAGELRVLKRLEFGAVRTGTARGLPLVIRNIHPRRNLKVTLSAPSAPFQLQGGAVTLLLPPRGSRGVNLFFSPTTRGPVTGLLAIASSDPARPTVNVVLTGNGR